ncbi:nucleolar protein 58-like [Biomphalaria glabrata]|uniref:Nucleolar protein 58 n=1 Tax=Biomphalaria glabrata TaxID=6526 RepID=A0A9W2Z4L7_BIOGL|nr:nucleolar protein 58-like [Biomphalaria glabrata]KAI8738918.1 nucleolar protein 58-like; partial [Biomphalaria glabrata]
MLVLFESAAGYALFKLLDESKLANIDNIYQDFETPGKASKILKLKHFEKFQNINEAVAANLTVENEKVSKNLKHILKKHILKDAESELAVADAKLGKLLKKKFDLNCVTNSAIQELMRNIRSQLDSFISPIMESSHLAQMSLGLAHSLGRYRLKFSPDKVDTMIVQAVSLLDDVDKELNNYIMRLREWYGWHFPELTKIITDNLVYARVVKEMGDRTHASKMDFSEILPENLETELKWAAEISMGTEISEEDIFNIKSLCEQVIEMSKTRDELYSYLKERMSMVAPNLTILVGELVGARLIAHAGSLLNLAKHPASTVQILGAEKALFRALKTKHDTPKYGLIYHASIVGSAQPKNKGKLSRMLSAKASLAIRVDALSETSDSTLGLEQRAKIESRVRSLDEKAARRISGTGKFQIKQEKYTNVSDVKVFNPAVDSTIPSAAKRKAEDLDTKSPVSKKIKLEAVETEEIKQEEEEESPKKKKKKKRHSEAAESEAPESQDADEPTEQKQKKKKKKKVKESAEDD